MASNLRVDTILPSTGTTLGIGTASGTINFHGESQINTTGVITASNFKTGSTNVHSGGLALGAGSTVGAVTGVTTYYGDGSQLSNITSTTINNNAANRVILGSGTANTLNADANLTFSNNQLTVHDAKLKGNQLLFTPSGTAYIDHSTVGQDIQIRVSTSSGNDTTGPKFRSDGNIETASNKGIYFGSSNANNFFDKYEEGTFTPTILNGWGILNSNPQIATGKYIRTGAIVYIYFTFKEGSGTGASFNGNRLALYTFPFNPDGTFGSGGGNNFSHPLVAYTNSNSSNGENVIGVPGSNGATVFPFITKASNGYGSFTGNDLSSSGQIFCAGTYRITGT